MMAKARNSIQFLLNGELREVNFSEPQIKPTTTVLNYLRDHTGLKGVKEGCAEGECGACTVVIAEPDTRGGLGYRCINSCLLFLPMIHGKQLITVEHLARKENGRQVLHPVQQALVDYDGSQCGYCTPGFVMAMFAMYKNHRNPSRTIVEEGLSGNLCRCTGYRPIVDAALHVCTDSHTDQFDEHTDEVVELLYRITEERAPLKLQAKNQLYLKPFTLDDALRLRAEHPAALITGGSTDAALLQTKKRIHLPEILDISAVDELNLIVEDHDKIVIGAGTSLEEILEFCRSRFPVMSNILEVFGSLQIRNLATLGGNIGSASPIGDTLPLLMALRSKVRLLSQQGARTMDVEAFITGYRKTALRQDELIAFIEINKPGPDDVIKSYKISKRLHLDIASVSAGFRLKLSPDGVIKEAILAYGGMAATPLRAKRAEAFLTGKTWDYDNARQAASLLPECFAPISDARANADARLLMARNLLLKYYEETKHQKVAASTNPEE